jgi:branched-chain amino acid transport system substrate-binding protein
MAKMRAMPIDYFGRPAKMRADGRVVYDLDLFQVKTPDESNGPYDFYKPVRHISADEAFPAVNTQTCPMAAN